MNSSGPRSLEITTSLTPYDIVIILLIHLRCIEDVNVSLEIFLKLISPTLTTPGFNPLLFKNPKYDGIEEPLLPILEDIIKYLLSADPSKRIAFALLKVLGCIHTFDTLSGILDQLNTECMVPNQKELRSLYNESQNSVSGKTVRRFTRDSFLGEFIAKCTAKQLLGDFPRRQTVLHCLKTFVTSFERTELWSQIQPEFDSFDFGGLEFSPLLSLQATQNDADAQMIELFQQYGGSAGADLEPDILSETQHLTSLLKWNFYLLSQDYKLQYEEERTNTIDRLIDNLSLHNITIFPIVYALNYFRYLKARRYQDALDSLHNYFDHILTKDSETYFHISLLCLATFYVHFQDNNSAVKAYEEAIAVAREHKDTETLTLIIIWLIDFIEENPEFVSNFHIKVDQIVRYLKSCPDDVDASVFQSAYRFETLLLLRRDTDLKRLFEEGYKYMMLSLERLSSEQGKFSALAFWGHVWSKLGFPVVANAYSEVTEPDPIDSEISEAFKALGNGRLNVVEQCLENAHFPMLKYEQRMKLGLLRVRYLIALRDVNAAMKLANDYIKKCTEVYVDSWWRFEFERIQYRVIIAAGYGPRVVKTLSRRLASEYDAGNALSVAECVLMLCEIQIRSGLYKEMENLLLNNLPTILQFARYRGDVFRLLKSVGSKRHSSTSFPMKGISTTGDNRTLAAI